MPNTIDTLKQEILRLAEKQAAAEVAKVRKAALQYRKQVVELKRLMRQQEKEIKYLKKQVPAKPEDAQLHGVRFSAKSVKFQRRRLGLSFSQYAKLVGVSTLSVIAWETGKARPRKAQFVRLVAVRGISKKEALQRLAKMS